METRQRVHRLLHAFVVAGGHWVDDETYRLGASLSYYALFSIFPLLLLSATLFGIALGDDASSRQRVLEFFSGGIQSPLVASTLDATLAGMQKHSAARGIGLVFGLVGSLLGASGVFSELDNAFNRVWRLKNRELHGVKTIVIGFLHDKLLSFGLVVLTCAGLIAAAVLSLLAWTVGSHLSEAIGAPWLLSLASPVASAALGIVAATALFRIVPRIKVPLRDAFAAAIVTGVLLFLLKQIFALYLSLFTGYAAYGVVGGLLALVTWIYIASLILLYGAEFSSAWHEARCDHPAQCGVLHR
jgi:membrane protein